MHQPELWNYVTWSREDALGMWGAVLAYLDGQRRARGASR